MLGARLIREPTDNFYGVVGDELGVLAVFQGAMRVAIASVGSVLPIGTHGATSS